MNKLITILLGIIVALITMLCIKSCQISDTKEELKIAQHNISVMQDTVKTLRMKNGELVSTIGSYIVEKKDLEKYLDISNAEIKELEKKLGSKVSYVSNTKTKTVYKNITTTDTVTIVDYINKYPTLTFNTKYDDEWLKLNSHTYIKDNQAQTTFDSIVVPIPLQVGITKDYVIWVKSKNPHTFITDIEGAVVRGSQVNPKKKHWAFGIQGGFGLQYDMYHHRFGYGPYIGAGFQYKFVDL